MPKRITRQRLAAFRVRPSTVGGLQCTAERLVARQHGRTNVEENIVAACRTCNGRRHQTREPRSPSEYRRKVLGRVKAGKWYPAPIRTLLP